MEVSTTKMIISELPVVRAFRLEKFLIAADWVARPGKERTPNQTSQELTKEMVKIRKQNKQNAHFSMWKLKQLLHSKEELWDFYQIRLNFEKLKCEIIEWM